MLKGAGKKDDLWRFLNRRKLLTYRSAPKSGDILF